jgi:hypothetical protein
MPVPSRGQDTLPETFVQSSAGKRPLCTPASNQSTLRADIPLPKKSAPVGCLGRETAVIRSRPTVVERRRQSGSCQKSYQEPASDRAELRLVITSIRLDVCNRRTRPAARTTMITPRGAVPLPKNRKAARVGPIDRRATRIIARNVRRNVYRRCVPATQVETE